MEKKSSGNVRKTPPVTPVEKIYEAWTAVADNRVTVAEGSTPDQGTARVMSSDGKKDYLITWRDNGTVFTSTDNATFWRGYPGYPVIAVLMLQGRVPYDASIAALYAGVNWTELNAAHKRDYAAALRDLEAERSIPAAEASEAAMTAYNALTSLHLTIRRK